MSSKLSDLLVPFARRREDGRVVGPLDVPSGRDADCICLECQGSVLAKHSRGGGRRPHFAHDQAVACGRAGVESALHAATKAALLALGELHVPELAAEIWDGALRRCQSVVPAGLTPLGNPRLEHAVLGYRADVLATVQGTETAIEVVVTADVSDDKAMALLQAGFACLEIRVDRARVWLTMAELQDALRTGALPMRWLVHPDLARTQSELRAEWKAQKLARQQATARQLMSRPQGRHIPASHGPRYLEVEVDRRLYREWLASRSPNRLESQEEQDEFVWPDSFSLSGPLLSEDFCRRDIREHLRDSRWHWCLPLPDHPEIYGRLASIPVVAALPSGTLARLERYLTSDVMTRWPCRWFAEGFETLTGMAENTWLRSFFEAGLAYAESSPLRHPD
ncbi:competence protein CoiA family protein [Derxia lacustris]|uniref:hypothetical protein n=1 Tax=Derxia lacustris TaxID=764842 RepID=UPI00111BF294|nr:hypothetical protein [Derxia lacustris]